MKEFLDIVPAERVVGIATEIEYGHRWDWCSSRYVSLKMSMIRPRRHFTYDPNDEIYPVIVFFCGGGWTEMDRNVWLSELTYFAKQGYAVASVEYSTTARTRFPMQIEDTKAAIRFLRANAREFGINAEKIVVLGESAGGYMSGITALSANHPEWDKGDYLDYSSAVQGAVCYYPCVDTPLLCKTLSSLPKDVLNYPRLQDLVTPSAPPFMILQGDSDHLVPVEQSDLLYDALEKNNIRCEYYIVHGADHASAHFFQPEMKERILRFLDSVYNR